MKPGDGHAIALPEACAIIAICFGYFIVEAVGALLQGASTNFTDDGMLSLITMELVLATAALLVLRLRGYPVPSLVPRPTALGSLLGIGIYLATIVACTVASLSFDASASEQVQDLVTHAQISMPVLVLTSAVNGTYEEVFLLGYLVRGFAGRNPSFALGLSVLVRLLYHVYQGPMGALFVVVYGIVAGAFYLRTRSLWSVVFAHILADVIAFV